MNSDIQLRFKPSEAFTVIVAKLNNRFSDWTDGSYDWAGQSVYFLHVSAPLACFDESLFKTPLTRRAVNDLLQVSIALPAGSARLPQSYGCPQLDPEPFMVQDKALEDRRWIERGDAAVRAVSETWSNLGLGFPAPSLL